MSGVRHDALGLPVTTSSGAALETYDRAAPRDVGDRELRTRVEELLRRAAAVEGSLRRGAGVGTLFEFRLDKQRGAALVAEGQVVHVAVL